MGKLVISLALFGERTAYAVYTGAVIRAYRTLFPEYEIWLHHDHHLDNSRWNAGRTLHRIEQMGHVKLVPMAGAPLTAAMLWRMVPIWDSEDGGVDFVFCRDMDSLPTPRDKACVDRFIESDMTLHTIHDSVSHAGVMGGLCGFSVKRFISQTGLKSLDALYEKAGYSAEQWAVHGGDQNALNTVVVPLLKGSTFEHRFAGWNGGHANPYSGRMPMFDGGISEPTPDFGEIPGRSPTWCAIADRLCSHMGASGFDYVRASAFYAHEGIRGVMEAIASAEAETSWT